MTRRLRVAVVGLGSMGSNHLRVLSELGHVQVVGASDPSAERREKVARYGAPTFASHTELVDSARPEAIILAAPTEFHAPLGIELAGRGIHLLVEKPLAHTPDDGRRLLQAAEQAGVLLQVGHVERFNPAVREARRLVASGALGRVFQLTARRLSPFPKRIYDVGVVIDLATHDIDAMHFITGSTVQRLFAETAQNAHSECEDMLAAVMRFESGAIGMLDVSWLSPQKVRELAIVGEGGRLVVDYLAQDVSFFKNGRLNDTWTPATHFSGAIEGDMVRTYIMKEEPLRAEVQAFVAAVLGLPESDAAPRGVTGAEALEALTVAFQLIWAGKNFELVRRQGGAQGAA